MWNVSRGETRDNTRIRVGDALNPARHLSRSLAQHDQNILIVRKTVALGTRGNATDARRQGHAGLASVDSGVGGTDNTFWESANVAGCQHSAFGGLGDDRCASFDVASSVNRSFAVARPVRVVETSAILHALPIVGPRKRLCINILHGPVKALLASVAVDGFTNHLKFTTVFTQRRLSRSAVTVEALHVRKSWNSRSVGLPSIEWLDNVR